jgi:hypothetical protein
MAGSEMFERLGQLPQGCLTLRQPDEDRPAGRIGNRAEGMVEHGHFAEMLINISVKLGGKIGTDGRQRPVMPVARRRFCSSWG